MIYTEEKILETLKKCNITNKTFFVGILPSFTFDLKNREVVGYHIGPTSENDLIVYNTEIVNLETTLEKHFKSLELSINDVLVFCINPSYLSGEKQIRYKIV